jgi:hypothetical protein
VIDGQRLITGRAIVRNEYEGLLIHADGLL